jgi:hypothetical protein
MVNEAELDRLTPKEERAAALRARGYSQADAYRATHNVSRATAKTIHEKASRLFARKEIRARVRDILREARIEDIDSIGQAFSDILDDIQAAREARNWAAVMAGQRLRAQVHGMLIQKVRIEDNTSDEELIRRLSGGDPAKAAVLYEILGAGNSFDDAAETQH